MTASLSNDSSSSVNVTFVAEFQLELEVIEDDALPDGSHVNKVKATVKNASDEFVQGAQVNFTSAEGVTITVPGTTDENGSVTATFTSYEPGTFSVRAVVGNDISETTNIHFVTVTGTLTLSPGSVVADGVSQVIITVDLKDENDQAVEGWSAQRPIRVLSSEELTSLDSDQNQLTEVGGGIYKITVIAGLVPGTDTFRIVSGLPNGTIVNNSAELTLTPLTPATGTISWSSDGIVRSVERTADGTTELTVTVKLKDSEGRPVRGWNPVSITSKLGLTRSISAGGEMTLSELAGTPGTYQGKVIVGTTAGTESIWVEQQVSFGNLRPMEAENGQQKGISLKQTAGELHSGTIELSSSSVPADGSSVVTLTVKLRDVYGNLVSNNGDVYVGSRRGLTNVPMGSGNYLILTEVSEGVYTTQIQAGTTAGDDDFWVVQASSFPDHIPGPMTGDNLVTLTLTPGELHSGTIELSSSSITANGTETTQLTVKLKDINGNLTDNEGTVYVQSSNGRTRVAASPGYTALNRTSLGTYTATLSGTVAGNERIWVEQLASFGALRPMPTNQGVDLTLTPGELHSGSIELSSSSITANGTETTQLTVKLKDINGNLTDNEGTVYVQSSNGRTRVAASPGYTALNRTSLGTYTATLSGTVAGNERIWVEQLASFGALRPMPVGQGVNLTLTAGPASSAWISLSEKTNGESLANSKSLVANGSNSTMIVVTVKDVKGNGVTGLESVLKVRAGAGALMKTGTGTAIARNTDYSGFEASTTAGVYYLKVVAGTTAGTETFWVSGGLEQGIVINNSVTITLTSPPPVSAKMNAWWSYNGGSNGSNYRTFSSAVRFLDSSNNAIQCDTVTVVGASGTGYAANANTTMANRHTFEGYNWSNNSSTFNAGTKVYSFTKDVSIGKNGGAGYVYSVVLAASGETTSPVIGHGSLGFDGMLTFTCTVGGTAYIFKSGDGKTAVDNTLGL
ncbi:invasin domain 3-containing protein [Entomohabitans teleogrylli]|uniref:invasin domain 3-containing protein n=1 Tax=Entomohabitans teleogrylli TaxID=1384589 RepID=UPI00201227C5|nr:invasin domain 3-containing protein [Entomohabitans teleogrylli]